MYCLSCHSPDAENAAEAATTTPAGASTGTLAAAKAVASLFVQGVPTLEVTKSCAQASLTHDPASTTISVDFGTGCTYPRVGTVAGQASATVSKTGAALSVAFTFTNLTVNAHTLSGTFTEATTDNTTFTVDANLTTATHAVIFQGSAALSPDGTSVTFDGSGTVQLGTAPASTITLTSVEHAFGDCYASAGSLGLSKTTNLRTLDETIVFSAATPSTSTVAVTVDSISSSQNLPPYGTCPHS
jgi:hypothetical protein